MHLNVIGHHLEITPALRSYVEKKVGRLLRHFDHVIDVNFVLTVEKLLQKAEATLHVRGETIHAIAEDTNMYAAIDALSDKLDRRVVKHKEKARDHHAAEAQKSARI
jgi:putative sigma-54 modulation protein